MEELSLIEKKVLNRQLSELDRMYTDLRRKINNILEEFVEEENKLLHLISFKERDEILKNYIPISEKMFLSPTKKHVLEGILSDASKQQLLSVGLNELIEKSL